MFINSNNLSAFINDARVRNIGFQVLIIGALAFSVWWLMDNTLTNLENRGKSLGFGFLVQTAGFEISDTLGTWLFDYEVGVSSYTDIYFIGITNTLLIAVLGIVFASIIGFGVGIMRLSNNFVLKYFATVYVEIIRNVPLLLQLFFWYFAVLGVLPGARNQLEIWGGLGGLNITGLYLPAPIFQPGFGLVFLAFIASLIIAFVASRISKKKQDETGQGFNLLFIIPALIISITGVTYVIMGSPLDWTFPEFKNTGPIFKRGFQDDAGMVLVPEMLAVLLALTLYTAGFIAEIVRAGIIAVSHGQTEASYSLGLRPSITLRLIVIPQAMRIIIPPLTSQYLNLTKNSSLAVAIAYPELVSIFAGTALNQVGKEIEMIFMVMSTYLIISLITSFFMNWFNARVKIVER
ncbi:MAG: putative glutamine ABC transporter permease protein GlnP [Alphaproteobacteria bacterium UBA4588]|nr:MAG: putative glutamine ABC transporter permease protein GlnP [Alphaproteobacteria bacterium UBA4588]